MKSITAKMVINFCLIAAISILVLGIVVSVEINQSISQQSEKLAADMMTRMYETLNLPHQTFELFIRKDIQRSITDLCTSPTLIANFESSQLKPMEAEVHKIATNQGLDFAILFNLKGQVKTSFPLDFEVFEVEEYFKSWEFSARAFKALKAASRPR